MTIRVAHLVVGLIVPLGCSSTGAGGTGGVGGSAQIPSDQAKAPEECEWLGGGGDDTVLCDYVTVDFSSALATSGLGVQATTSVGDVLTPTADEWPDELALILSLDDSATQATGFTITRIAQQPHYSPAEVAVMVTVDDTLIADATLEPSYTCVELTSDDWCWKGMPLTLDVSPWGLERTYIRSTSTQR